MLQKIIFKTIEVILIYYKCGFQFTEFYIKFFFKIIFRTGIFRTGIIIVQFFARQHDFHSMAVFEPRIGTAPD